MRQNYRVGLVLTITTMGRASARRHVQLSENTIEFTMGNYRLWLKAYVAYRNGQALKVSDHDDPGVQLDCVAIVGQTMEYTPFGRGTTGRGSSHRPGLIDVIEQD